MVLSKEVLGEYRELYEKATKLVETDSREDPPTDPYRSHYKARDVLHDLKKQLEIGLVSVRASEDYGEAEVCYVAMMAFVCRDLGRIYVYTEETGEGEMLLKKCVELVEPHQQKAECIIPFVGAINELSIVLASRQDYKEAVELLLKADKSYKEFKASSVVALNMADLYSCPDEQQTAAAGPMELESLYTLTCFYLAQMYGHLGEPEKSAECCHRTLHRQLQYKSYDPIDFALNTATLSQYYIGEERFKEARHHLAAATLIMAEYETEMVKPEMTEQQRNDVTETFKHRYADVARCWAKYGLFLLHTSKERLMRDDDDEDTKLNKAAKRLTLSAEEEESKQFPGLDLTACEDRITADYCLTFDDAKLVFFFVNEWLGIAIDYYKAETEATEYAKIIQDYAEVYEQIAFFEENPENQAKMHKKRATYLEDLLELLDPIFYLKICRECWYGAGTAHAAVLDIRLDIIKAKNTPSPEEIKKVNQSCMKAIKNFESFIKSYKAGPASDEWRPNMDVEEQRTLLYAHFHVGRLYYKLISGNPVQQLEHLNNCLKFYTRFNTECTARPEVSVPLQGEVGVVREMLQLLPMKIKTVQARLPPNSPVS